MRADPPVIDAPGRRWYAEGSLSVAQSGSPRRRPGGAHPSRRHETMTTTADSLESLREYGKERGYDVRWLERRDVWGQQLDASEKKGGLLLQDVDGGVAAEVPDESKNLTGRTRGSLPRSG